MAETRNPLHIVVMGVAASGKSTLAKSIAKATGSTLVEADEFHPPANVEKMSMGVALDDDDRWPWLARLRDQLTEQAGGGNDTVMACSALKRGYRDVLRQAGGDVVFIHLTGDPEILQARINARAGHFMPTSLLPSQLATLEQLDDDENGILVDIALSVPQQRSDALEALAERFSWMSTYAQQVNRADLGLIGAGVMGGSLARNLGRNGHRVAILDRDLAKAKEVAAHDADQLFAVEEVASLVSSLKTPRVVILLVPAGEPTDNAIESLVPFLETGDIIVDLGNAYFVDTRRRESALRELGLHFVGCGISGGEEGALWGPSLMVGGSKPSYERLGPLFESIAARVGDEPCCVHVGPDGSGHYVKMVHNGIEYADMQLIAEIYELLRVGCEMEPEAVADVFATWCDEGLRSYLLEISIEILRHRDAAGQPFVDIIDDAAGQKGTGSWTTQDALTLGAPSSVIAGATFARAISSSPNLRGQVQGALGAGAAAGGGAAGAAGVAGMAGVARVETSQLRDALAAAKLIAYAQGLWQIWRASLTYGWDVSLADIAKVWRAGCIIRSDFLDDVSAAFTAGGSDRFLLATNVFASVMARQEAGLRAAVAWAVAQGIPVPALSAAVSFLDAARSPRLSTALVQAQRDFFGSHTYRRVDKEGTFHTLWAGDRSEVEIS